MTDVDLPVASERFSRSEPNKYIHYAILAGMHAITIIHVSTAVVPFDAILVS